jgi:hypothetical protein
MQFLLLAGALVAIVLILFISYISIGAIKQAVRNRRAKTMLVCSLDDDCPDGFECRDGRCQPA